MDKKLINTNKSFLFKGCRFSICIDKNLVMNSVLKYNFIITCDLSDDVQDICRQLIQEIGNWKYQYEPGIFQNKEKLIDLFKLNSYYINTVRSIIDVLSDYYANPDLYLLEFSLSNVILHIIHIINSLSKYNQPIIKFTILCIILKQFKLRISDNFHIVLNALVDNIEQKINLNSASVGFLKYSDKMMSGNFLVDIKGKEIIVRLRYLIQELINSNDSSFLDIPRKLYHYNQPQQYNTQVIPSLLPKQGTFTALRFI